MDEFELLPVDVPESIRRHLDGNGSGIVRFVDAFYDRNEIEHVFTFRVGDIGFSIRSPAYLDHLRKPEALRREALNYATKHRLV